MRSRYYLKKAMGGGINYSRRGRVLAVTASGSG